MSLLDDNTPDDQLPPSVLLRKHLTILSRYKTIRLQALASMVHWTHPKITVTRRAGWCTFQTHKMALEAPTPRQLCTLILDMFGGPWTGSGSGRTTLVVRDEPLVVREEPL